MLKCAYGTMRNNTGINVVSSWPLHVKRRQGVKGERDDCGNKTAVSVTAAVFLLLKHPMMLQMLQKMNGISKLD